jgi:hypothetical protein
LPTSELGTGDSCGDGHVETLSSIDRTVTGYEQAMGYTGSYLWRDTIAFIAHDDNTVGGKWLVVDVFAVE